MTFCNSGTNINPTIQEEKLPPIILFDWDKTLADNWLLIIDSLNHTFEHYRMPQWTVEEANQRISLSAREMFPSLFHERTEEALSVFYSFFEKNHLKYIKEIPPAKDLISYLCEQGYLLGVVSNKKKDLLSREIKHLNLTNFFSVVIGAGDATQDKPSPEPIKLAINEINKKHNKTYGCIDILYVGDSDVDIKTAENIGCPIFFINNSKNIDFTDKKNTFKFNNLKDLFFYIKKIS